MGLSCTICSLISFIVWYIYIDLLLVLFTQSKIRMDWYKGVWVHPTDKIPVIIKLTVFYKVSRPLSPGMVIHIVT